MGAEQSQIAQVFEEPATATEIKTKMTAAEAKMAQEQFGAVVFDGSSMVMQEKQIYSVMG